MTRTRRRCLDGARGATRTARTPARALGAPAARGSACAAARGRMPARVAVALAIVVASAGAVRSVPGAPSASAPALELRAEVTVRDGVVRLGDLVVDCPPGVRDVRVLDAPDFGSVRVVPRSSIVTRLARVAHIRARFSGATSVRIHRPGGDRSEEIYARIRRALDSLVSRVEGLEYEPTWPDRPVRLPPGPMRTEVSVSGSLEGHRVARARVRVPGAPERTVAVGVRFVRRVRVPVAARRIARGDTLGPGDVRWEVRRFDRAVPPCLPRGADVRAWRARATIDAGTLLSRRVVEPHPAVQAGQEVTLELRRGPVRVSARARALQTGWPGSRIRVQSLVDRRYLTARVVEPGVVVYE